MKCKNRFFAYIRQQWIDWFTSNQDHNDQQPILHIFSSNDRGTARRCCFSFYRIVSSNDKYISPAKIFRLCRGV